MRSISGKAILIAAAAISAAAVAAGAETSAAPPIIPPRPARAAGHPTKARPLDLNTASARELETLPGVGPAEARRIVDARPFASASELSRADLPNATQEKIRPLVTVAGAGASTPMGAAGAPMRPPLPAGGAESVAPPHRGMVWADPDARTYRPAGDPASGRTPHGRWMSESAAIREGYRKAA